MVGIRRPSAVWGGFPLYLTDVGHDAMAALGVRRGKAAFFSAANPAPPSLQPEATGAIMEATKWLKPSV